MAQNETWLKHDLLEAVKVQYLDGNLFSLDNAGNLIGVTLTRDGADYSGGGSVSANVIRSDGGTVAVSGALSGKTATVVLPQAAYAVPGVVSIVVKLTVSGQVTTIAALVANVYRSSTDTAIDPGTIIPSVQALIAAIDTAVASIPADYSSLWASLAPAFSTSSAYTAGQYVTYNGGLYRFTTDHAAGAWNSSQVASANLGGEISDLKSAMSAVVDGGFIPLELEFTDGGYISNSGENVGEVIPYQNWKYTGFIDISSREDNSCFVFTTAPNGTTYNAFYNSEKTCISIFDASAGSITPPATAKYVRMSVQEAYNCGVKIKTNGLDGKIGRDEYTTDFNNALSFKGNINALGITNIDNIIGNGIYVCSDYTGITGLPVDANNIPIVGTIIVSSSLNVGTYRGAQYLIGRDQKIHVRVKNSTSSWTNWDTEIFSNEIIGNALMEYSGGQITDNSLLTDANNCANNTIYRINIGATASAPNNLPARAGILYSVGWNNDGTETKMQLFASHGGKLYYRLGWAGTWSSWTDLSESKDEILSSFERYSSISQIIKNVVISGTSKRICISNIRNNYNGQTGFAIFESNDNGDAVSALINETAINSLSGTYTAELPNETNTAKIKFEYDLNLITSGDRMSGTGLDYLVSKRCYDIDEIEFYGDFGFIEDFGVIGDSYASGEVYVDDDNANGYIAADYYNLSWGQVLARKYGAECTNFSKGGLSTKTWLTDTKGLALLNSETPKQLYFCALGINDLLKYGATYIGTVSDIHNDPSENPDSFYGNYGKIVSAIKAKSPNAKIVFVTFAYNYSSSETTFNNAIKTIANHYGVPCIDVNTTSFFSSASWYHTGKKWNHPTAPIYAAMAKEYAKLFSKCVIDNNAYFEDYTGVVE